ncbi:MAG: ShlB/FhaC/HecB family protein [Leptospirales bacterium]
MRTLARHLKRSLRTRLPVFLAGALLIPAIPGLSLAGNPPSPPQQVAANPLVPSSPPLPGISSPGPGSPSSPPPPETSSRTPVETEYFKHGKRLNIKAPHGRSTFFYQNRSILRFVSNRVFPHPSAAMEKEISQAIDALSRGLVHGATLLNGNPLVADIPRDRLNHLAALLTGLVKPIKAQPKRVRIVKIENAPTKDRPFLARNLGAASGDIVDPSFFSALSKNLFAMSQLPGYTRADALLVPTGDPALDDLLVKTTSTPTLAGSQLETDNYGYAPTGAVTLNGTLDINDSLLTGDQLVALASTSFFGMNSGTLAYSIPATLFDRFGIDMNALDYRLGLGFSPWGHGATVGQLVALGLSGSNYSFDGWGMHSFVKTPTTEAFVKATLFLKEFQDNYSATVQNDRSILGGTLELSGSKTAGRVAASFDLADTEYDLSQGSGSSASSANSFYYKTQGIQNYWTENAGIRYSLTPVYAVYLSTVDQQYIGGGVLDPMLQGVLGGMSNVRALPTAALFGNNLYSGSLNLLRSDAVRGGSLVSSLFFDVGQVTGIGTQYSAMGPGVEESWTGAHLFGKADLAVPVGPLPVSALGSQMVALTGGNIQSGGIPLQLWLSLGWRY